MKWTSFVVIIGFAIITALFALSVAKADPPLENKKAEDEIIRRGDHVEVIGTIQGGPDSVRTAAVQPPEDDSDRWFITVVTTQDTKYAAACDKLLADINALQLKGWIRPQEPDNSWAHYQVRMLEDDTQKDWLKGVRSQLEGHDFPAMLFQPPANGKFGKNARIVGIVHGYDGNASKLNQRIAEIIKGYADTMVRRGVLQAGGIQAPAPFQTPQTALDPMLPRNPVVWPAEVFEKKPLTYSEIRALTPKAPASFARDLVKQRVTEQAEVSDAYEEFLDEAKPDSANPSWLPSSLWDVLAVIGLAAIPLLGMFYHQRHQEQLRLSRESAPQPTEEPKSRTGRPTGSK